MESFERTEKKYVLEAEQYNYIKQNIQSYVDKDEFYQYKINSLYYDTDSYELIRRSIEKPKYKEKLRIRCYNEPDEQVHIEFKKKYDKIVYKRRTKVNYHDALNDIKTCEYADKQIGNEIKYALAYYGSLKPAIFVSSERISYKGKQDNGLRITFDDKLKYRMNNLSLNNSKDDKEITKKIIMEIKVNKAFPLWLSKILDEAKAYPQGFSKVGTAYLNELKEAK